MTEKSYILTEILAQLSQKLAVLTDAAKAAYEAATHSESKPENQYDTRGLEAAYLAGAQAKRSDELRNQVSLYKTLHLRTFSPQDPIALTALIEVEYDGKCRTYFIGPQGGGLDLEIGNHRVTAITPSSVLGEAFLGHCVGDVVEIDIGSVTRVYQIISIK